MFPTCDIDSADEVTNFVDIYIIVSLFRIKWAILVNIFKIHADTQIFSWFKLTVILL